jgi:hypothetical protein
MISKLCAGVSISRHVGQLLYDREHCLRLVGQRCVAWAIDYDGVDVCLGRSFGFCSDQIVSKSYPGQRGYYVLDGFGRGGRLQSRVD